MPLPADVLPSLWLLVILLTLTGVALGRFPRLHMNRATIALVGATGLIVLGAIPLEDAYRAVDMHTITLLLAMMVINANLRLAGFFRLAAVKVTRWAHTPGQLLALLMASAGLLSALFLNDTVVLIFTPLLVELTVTLGLHPVPFLVGLAVAANIGSTATIIGNPQNMLIGMSSAIPFLHFTARLFPVAVGGLFIAWGVLRLVYRQELTHAGWADPPPERLRVLRPLLWKSLVATVLMLVALVNGTPIPLAALGAAALLLVTRRIKAERVFQEIDWSLLVFFAALFVVTGAMTHAGFSQALLAWGQSLVTGGVLPLTVAGAVLSNLVSNVPAVMLLRPVLLEMGQAETAWLTLAMATTLAGNLTLLGSMANLIVAESARARGVRLSFRDYLRGGLPVTLLTLLWGVIWLGRGG